MRRRDGEDGRSMELGGFYALAATNMMGTKTLQEILSGREAEAKIEKP